MNRSLVTIFVLATLSAPVLAKSPTDIADLIGARAAGAESEIQARGYDNVKNNIWWNGATGTCVRVHVSNGRYSAIDTLKPSACGQKGSSGTAPSGGKPAVQGTVPQAALSACVQRADEFQNARRGASVATGAERSGPNWVLTMGTGQYTSRCTVSGSGRVVSIDPI
ncbi:hypothetical protein ASE04_00015 [Rhizobium sp. Root708]|uniref:hypothetical protein n=1 Tax=Rhizobium sp. Root708 TaxID=1736592 RepID=UPI0006F2B9D2|nr:hypothetical protein [Rhizobium sp. Root708]KRB62612.1 hypothetical protein ASE04_00015 [Rhizobium sp. Root708]